jgi:protein involved in polysaccharide export with SLBB domain
VRVFNRCGGLLAVLVLLIVCVVEPRASYSQESDSLKTHYALGPGDKLKLVVFGQEDLSGEFDVDGNGFVSLPLVGGVAVGRKSIAEAESAIIKALKPDYLKNPRVSLQVLNYRPFYIIGEVNNPGSYPYVNGITVLEAVAIAGGFTYRAKEGRMSIIRGTDSSRDKADVSPETLVLPGDVIEVPERFF